MKYFPKPLIFRNNNISERKISEQKSTVKRFPKYITVTISGTRNSMRTACSLPKFPSTFDEIYRTDFTEVIQREIRLHKVFLVFNLKRFVTISFLIIYFYIIVILLFIFEILYKV